MSLVRFRSEAPFSADLAHLVERDLAKVEVAGSSPVIRSIIRHHSQVVRQRSAKPLRPGSNPGGASKTKSTSQEVLFVLERCLPLRASDVAFGSDVHCVSDVSPCGEVGKHHITLRRRRNTSLCVSTTSLRRSRNITLYKQPKV